MRVNGLSVLRSLLSLEKDLSLMSFLDLNDHNYFFAKYFVFNQFYGYNTGHVTLTFKCLGVILLRHFNRVFMGVVVDCTVSLCFLVVLISHRSS